MQAHKQVDSYTQTNHVAVNRRNAHKLDIWGRQGQQKSCTVQIARDSCVLAGPTRNVGSNLAHRRHQRHSRPRACVIGLSLETGWTKTCCGQRLTAAADHLNFGLQRMFKLGLSPSSIAGGSCPRKRCLLHGWISLDADGLAEQQKR